MQDTVYQSDTWCESVSSDPIHN